MKKSLFAAAVVALALVSCNKKAEEVKDAAAAKVEEGAAKVEAAAKEVKEEVKK